IRLLPASCAASVNLSNDRTSPGKPGDVMLKLTRSPKNEASAWAADSLWMACKDTYDWWLGVAIRGVQVGSALVSGLPSVSAARIAVTGRQKLYSYLASTPAMKASAMETFKSANSRAFWARVLSWAAATVSAIRFQMAMPPLVGPTPQNRAIFVCSVVRALGVVTPSPPRDL